MSIPGHPSDPRILHERLSPFRGGEFVIQKPTGLIYHGKLYTAEVPDLSIQEIAIVPEIVDTRDHPLSKEWKRLEPLPERLIFQYTWYHSQPRHQRLKLESVVEVPKGIGGEGPKRIVSERCWLCSSTNPIFLAHFRAMLIAMFIEEKLKKPSTLKAWRNKFMVRRAVK